MYWIGPSGGASDAREGTDFHAIAQGHIAITPLQVDLTDHSNLGGWRQAWPLAEIDDLNHLSLHPPA